MHSAKHVGRATVFLRIFLTGGKDYNESIGARLRQVGFVSCLV